MFRTGRKHLIELAFQGKRKMALQRKLDFSEGTFESIDAFAFPWGRPDQSKNQASCGNQL